jgi:tight adherence protein C
MMLAVLKAALTTVVFSSVAVFAYTMLAAPGGEAPHLGVRGLRRTQSLRENPLWARLEPVVRWFGVRLRPLVGGPLRARLDRQITLAGDFWGLLPEELVALTLLSFTFFGSVGAAYALSSEKAGALYPLLGVVGGVLLPFLHLSSTEHERGRRVRDGLPSVIDLLSLGLSAGLDFPGALRQVVEKTSTPRDPLIEEIQLVLQELSVGKTRKQALLELEQRVPNESTREFVAAVIQAEERGNPLADVLRIQAESSRQRRSVRAEEAAARASVKMFAPILMIVVVVMLLILTPLLLGLEKSFAAS